MGDANPRDFIEIDDQESIKQENRKKVANQAKTKGN